MIMIANLSGKNKMKKPLAYNIKENDIVLYKDTRGVVQYIDDDYAYIAFLPSFKIEKFLLNKEGKDINLLKENKDPNLFNKSLKRTLDLH
jgi:hypothetical protein